LIVRSLPVWPRLAAVAAVAAAMAAGCSGDRAEAAPAGGWSTAAQAAEPSPVASAAPGAAPGAASSPAPAAADSEDFPLKQWMSANLGRAIKTEDFPALERALASAAGFAPPEFPGWRAIAERGSRAAAARNIAGARDSCTQCHNKFRAEYRAKMRTRLLSQTETDR
jgi:hypothetical protein